MPVAKTKKAPKHLPKSFDEYKAIKDEIIEISEQRFENILNKRLAEFRKELLADISGQFDPKFKMLMWFLGVSMTFVIGILSVILNKVLK